MRCEGVYREWHFRRRCWLLDGHDGPHRRHNWNETCIKTYDGFWIPPTCRLPAWHEGKCGETGFYSNHPTWRDHYESSELPKTCQYCTHSKRDKDLPILRCTANPPTHAGFPEVNWDMDCGAHEFDKSKMIEEPRGNRRAGG